MNDYWTKTYGGFYCTLCDADNHYYIDLKKKKLFISEGFCREFLEKNL